MTSLVTLLALSAFATALPEYWSPTFVVDADDIDDAGIMTMPSVPSHSPNILHVIESMEIIAHPAPLYITKLIAGGAASLAPIKRRSLNRVSYKRKLSKSAI
jgi:hypothetical protein